VNTGHRTFNKPCNSPRRPGSSRTHCIVEAGGKIHVEEQEVPGMGAFSLFTDPEGRMMGLWKTARR